MAASCDDVVSSCDDVVVSLLTMQDVVGHVEFSPWYYCTDARGSVRVDGASRRTIAVMASRRDASSWSASVAACASRLQSARAAGRALTRAERADACAHTMMPHRSMVRSDRVWRALTLYADLRDQLDDLFCVLDHVVVRGRSSMESGAVSLTRARVRQGGNASILFGSLGASRPFVVRVMSTDGVAIAPYMSSRLSLALFVHVMSTVWQSDYEDDVPYALNLTPSPTLEWLPVAPGKAVQIWEYHSACVTIESAPAINDDMGVTSLDAYEALTRFVQESTDNYTRTVDDALIAQCETFATTLLHMQVDTLHAFHDATSYCHNDAAGRNFLLCGAGAPARSLRLTDFDFARHHARHPIIVSGDGYATTRASGPEFSYFLLDYITLLWCCLEEHACLCSTSRMNMGGPVAIFERLRARLRAAMRCVTTAWLRTGGAQSTAHVMQRVLDCVVDVPARSCTSLYGPRVLLLQPHVQCLSPETAFDMIRDTLRDFEL